MYLSRVALDVHRRSTAVALVNPQQIHGAVEQAFPGERAAALAARFPRKHPLPFDSQRGYARPAQPHRPIRHRAAARSEGLCAPSQQNPPGKHVAVPPDRKPHEKLPGPRASGPGIVHAHCSVEYQKQWLLDRAESTVSGWSRTASLLWTRTGCNFTRARAGRPFPSAPSPMRARLAVTDAELFKKLLTEGIGRGKAYGLGLMTVIGRRPQNA